MRGGRQATVCSAGAQHATRGGAPRYTRVVSSGVLLRPTATDSTDRSRHWVDRGRSALGQSSCVAAAWRPLQGVRTGVGLVLVWMY